MTMAVDHPTVGEVQLAGAPLKFTGTDDESHRPPPLLGQHTWQILREVTDYTPERIETLLAQGVIAAGAQYHE
jgi:crotonobetainyl-CoA:carnitine CoA-transferase CaiB-like acyl-CoA transferase